MSQDFVTLQPELLRLLRAAETVTFHHDQTGGYIQIPEWPELVVPSVMAGEFVTGFCVLQAARFKPEWVTIARNLHPGDQIGLRWQPDSGTNDHLREIDLHADELHLRVRRSDRQTLIDDYLLCYHVAPTEWGRMVS